MAKPPTRKVSPEPPRLTRLGKIESAEFGRCGPDQAWIGVILILASPEFRFRVEERAQNPALIPEGEAPTWVDDDFKDNAGAIINIVGDILRDARRNTLNELVNIPVEVISSGNQFLTWRILKEVL